MKRVGLIGAAIAATLGAVLPTNSKPARPPRKIKKARVKAQYVPKYYGKGKYTPAGPHRNCGYRGISPKKVKS